jgi:hypothetical protein
MPFVKGKSGNPKGKKKGTPTKKTQSVKEAFRLAFEGVGGVRALVAWAKEEKTEFFKIYSKLLPREVELSGELNLRTMDDDALDQKILDIVGTLKKV